MTTPTSVDKEGMTSKYAGITTPTSVDKEGMPAKEKLVTSTQTTKYYTFSIYGHMVNISLLFTRVHTGKLKPSLV